MIRYLAPLATTLTPMASSLTFPGEDACSADAHECLDDMAAHLRAEKGWIGLNLNATQKTLVPGPSAVYPVRRGDAELEIEVPLVEPPPRVVEAWIGHHLLHRQARVVGPIP